MDTRSRTLPLRFTITWMAGTFLVFLLAGDIDGIKNLGVLTLFISATILLFLIGFRLQAGHSPVGGHPSNLPAIPASTLNVLVTLSGLYYVAYGIVYMRQYSVLNLDALATALINPGGAYLAKFDIYQQQASLGLVDPSAQVLTLLAVLSAPLIPFLVVYWSRITPIARSIAFLGLFLYVAFFLAIGTLVGLGNILIFAAASTIVVKARNRAGLNNSRQSSKRSRAIVLLLIVVGFSFAGYMSYNQGQRISQTSIEGDYEPNPVIQKVFGESFARGASVMLFYPTHGYRGLSYNLETPFVWTEGRGSSRALDSYLEQYGLGDAVFDDTYPARTEQRTGWPAGMYWATIYPWLASDLTFPGAILFMGFFGWWVSRWWREAVDGDDPLALLLFAQSVAVIAYIPANNQLGTSRPNLIAITCLLAIYFLRSIRRVIRRSRRANVHASGHRNRT